MTETTPSPGGDPIDQDAEPTMTAPPEDRPDAAVPADGRRADSPDAVDADAHADEAEA